MTGRADADDSRRDAARRAKPPWRDTETMRRALIIAIICVLCAILGISIWQIAAYVQQSKEGAALYGDLAAMMAQQNVPDPGGGPPGGTQPPTEATQPPTEATQPPTEATQPVVTPEPTAVLTAEPTRKNEETTKQTATGAAQQTAAVTPQQIAQAPAITPKATAVTPQQTAQATGPGATQQPTASPLASPAPMFIIEEEPAATASPTPGDGILPQYRAFLELNPDMIGWLSIDGTNINYPVVQRAGDDEYYVHRDFYGNDAIYGCLFAQATCDVKRPSDNVIIYGHNMRDNSMFGLLDEYKDYEFYRAHPTFRFDTIWEEAEYEIFAAFKTYVYSEASNAFKYYQFIDAKDEAEFNRYIERCRNLSIYYIPADVKYGDRIVMLSTCEYSHANGRFVVVGRKITEGTEHE